MKNKCTRESVTLQSPADRRDSGGQNCNTRMPKRKASPEKMTPVKRRRVTELPGPSMNSKEGECMVRGQKRKVQHDGEGPSNPTKKIRLLDRVQGDEEPASSSVDTSKDSSTEILKGCSDNKEKVCTRNGKRKAAGDGKVPPRKRQKVLDQEETKSGTKKSVAEQRREFEARYIQQNRLGEGGCGTVFAGYRKKDNFPVAIKHIPKNKIYCKIVDKNGKQVSVEVAVMLKLAAGTGGSVGTSASVSLLEWFDLDVELILVLERPVPAVDLDIYIAENGGSLSETKAKVILKQLIDAAKELQDKNIFHRDIKSENILIETGSDVPRVRLIDFGLSCFVKKRSLYRVFYGTLNYSPPEWYTRCSYRSGPTTVWQLGVVLYEALHPRVDFETRRFLRKKLKIKKQLSKECQNFLNMCLNIVPEKRPTLEGLLLHPWLR